MEVWRLTLARHAPDGGTAFSGEGARLYGGRWNSKGLTVAYGAATLSLAALEYLVHADVGRLSKVELVACVARCPPEMAVETVRVDRLSAGWRGAPAAHPDAARIVYGRPEPFRFDARLLAGRGRKAVPTRGLREGRARAVPVLYPATRSPWPRSSGG